MVVTSLPVSGIMNSTALGDALQPIITSFIRDINYQQPPVFDYRVLAELVENKIALYGVQYLPEEDNHSYKCLHTGLIMASAAYAEHSLEEQAYIAIFTWLVCIVDDVVDRIRPELEQFQERFYNNDTQPNALLEALASIMKETYLHYENIVANFIIVSSLSFVSATLLEGRPEYATLVPTKGGKNMPYYVRDKGGLAEAYAYFIWTKSAYPDIGQFMEAIYDIACYINLVNDILSFYKEELSGDRRNYVNLRARYAETGSITALEDTIGDAMAAFQRVNLVFNGRKPYARGWNKFAMGYVTFHVSNPRYRLTEFGLPVQLTDIWNIMRISGPPCVTEKI